MKRTALTFVALVVLASSALGQGGTVKQPSMRGVKRSEPSPALPTLVVGINASIGTITEPGWPLIVTATVNSGKQPPPSPIPADLQIRMTSESGGVVAMNFENITPVAPASDEPSRYWLVAESETARLAPGRYRVTIVSPAPGWQIESGEIRVLAPNPERSGTLPLLKIQRLLLQNRDDDALVEADRAITAKATNLQAWIAKGDIFMKKDDPDKALEAYDRALILQRSTGRSSFPLQKRQKAAQVRALEKRGVLSSPPP